MYAKATSKLFCFYCKQTQGRLSYNETLAFSDLKYITQRKRTATNRTRVCEKDNYVCACDFYKSEL